LRGIADELSSCVTRGGYRLPGRRGRIRHHPPRGGENGLARARGACAGPSSGRRFRQGTEFSKLTVSIGLATFPSYGDTGQAVLRAADVALYKAKAAGRNRVTLCTPNVARNSPVNVA